MILSLSLSLSLWVCGCVGVWVYVCVGIWVCGCVVVGVYYGFYGLNSGEKILCLFFDRFAKNEVIQPSRTQK